MTNQIESNIILCGLPGAGKTTVGKKLASILNREFFDVDQLIEEQVGMTCREYYRLYGESAFRNVETHIVHSLQNKTNVVIALGGGAVEVQEIVNVIPVLGIVVHLFVEMDRLIQRKIIQDKPATVSDEQSYRDLASRRLPLLKKVANIEIHSKNKQTDQISREIIDEVRRYCGG